MKKIISKIIVALLSFGLVACSDSPNSSESFVISQSQNSTSSLMESSSFSESIDLGDWEAIQPNHSFNYSEIEDYALVLTDHIVTRVLNNIKEGEVSDRGIFDFVITLCLYHDNADHPYSDIVRVSENGGIYAQYSEPAVQRMVYELFGVSDWSYEDNQHELIRKNQYGEDEYHFSMEAGLPSSSYSYSELSIVTQSDGLIEAEFKLIDSPYNNSSKKEYGMHRITFQLVEESDISYLRFVRFLPV